MLAEVLLSFNIPKDKRIINYTGHKFDTGAIVLGYLGYIESKHRWLISCKCDNEYIISSQDLKYKKNQYCSKCIPSKRRNMVGKIVGNNCKIIDEIFTNTCETRKYKVICHCNNIWVVSNNHINYIKECRKCVDRKRGLNNRGKNHYKFNKFLSDEDRIKNRTHALPLSIKKDVLIRDGYKCQISNKSDNLVLHHLDGWNWCISGRYDINNLITLNYDIHKKFHDIYGRGNNTKEQFEEFAEKYRELKKETSHE